MVNNSSQRAAHKALAAVLTACLSVPAVPLTALAETPDADMVALAESGTVDCDNWTLSYTVENGQAVITGYAYQGAAGSKSDLTIPEDIQGVPVTTLAAGALKGCQDVDVITLPDSVQFVEAEALRSTSATEIHFGAGLRYIQQYGVANNAEMKVCDFAEGCAPEFFQQNAFTANVALTELRVPALTGNSYLNLWYSKNGRFRIGQFCFSECTNLKRVIYEAGNANSRAEYYNSEIYEVYSGMGSDFSIVAYTKLYPTNGGYVTKARDAYFAVYFYDSQKAAEADPTGENAKAVTLVAKGSKVTEVSAGTLSTADYLMMDEAGAAPSLAEVGVTDEDMVWGLGDSMLSSESSTLSNVVAAYPVSKGDMSYAYVTSDRTDLYNSYTNQVTENRKDNAAFYRLKADGTTDLSDFQVHTADGSVLEDRFYVLKFSRRDPQERGQSTTYTDLKSAAEVNEAGTYGVRAFGVLSGCTDTKTAYLPFYVRRYDASVYDYTGKIAVGGAATALYNVSTQAKGAAFVTLAPASSWQASLVATAAAGMGGGLAIYSDGTDGNDGFYQAINNTGAKYLVSVGSASAIGTAAVTRAKLVLGSGVVASSLDGAALGSESYEESLARTVYEKLKKAGTTFSPKFAWGDTAVVVSRTSCLNTAAIAQYAYAKKAPVFFANASGGLSAATLKDLGDFKNVVIAGTTQEVSVTAANQIAAACGATPRRIMTGANAVTNSTELANLLMKEEGCTNASINVGLSTEPVSVFAAAQCAALQKGITLACTSSIDVKQSEAYLQTLDLDAMEAIRLIGPMTSGSGSVGTRFTKLAAGQPLSTAPQAGDTVVANGLKYKMLSASTLQLEGFAQGATTAVTVPSAVTIVPGKTAKVTAIAASAFKGQTALKSLALSADVQTIGANAFEGCTGLTSVTGGAAVTSVGASAFSGCTALTAATLGAKVTSLGASAFQGCTKLTSVSMGPALKTLGASAFQGCANLTTVSASAQLTVVPSKAFYGCAKLKALTIPATCTSIGAEAFSGCKALAKVSATAVKTVGANAFFGCTGLTSASLGSKLTSVGVSAFQGCTALATASLGTSLTSLGASAFQGCAKLTSVTVGKKLTAVPSKAFYGCAKLKTFAVPTACTSIGASAFYGCKALTKVTSGTKVRTLGASAFQGCSSLTSVALGTKVTKIPTKAFYGCAKLKTFKVPAACTSIGTSAFYGCKAMTKVTGGAKVKTIGTTAFRGCAKLKSVALGSKLTTIGSKAFYGCKVLASLTVPAAVKKIGASAFSGCKKLTTLKVKSAKLTKTGVKGALKGSSVKTVSLTSTSAKKKLSSYKKYFTKAVAGKKVTVKKA